MAVITSTSTGGNASSGSSWAGGVAPVDGDTIVVASGATVTQDVNRTYGSNASAVGHAVTVNGTNAATFGTLRVASGVTLTLRGTDATSNTLGLVNRFGLFQPLSGSTVLGDVAGDYASVILNKGRFEPQTGVTFGVPAANVNWASKVNSEVKSGATAPGIYDTGLNLVVTALANPLIANGTQTGEGGTGDFPTGQTSGGGQGIYASSGFPTAPTTEVSVTFPATAAQIAAAVNAAGKYAVNYDTGVVYLYSTTATGLTLSVNYNKLDKSTANWRGWGVVSGTTATLAGNTCLIDGCTFNYMGCSSSTGKVVNAFTCSAPVALCNHQTAGASGDVTTTAYLKNSTINYGFKWAQLFQCVGTALDPVLVSGNALNDCSGGLNIDGLNVFASYARFVTVDSNAFRHRGAAIDLTNVGADVSNLSITNNTGTVGTAFITGAASGGARTPFPFLNDPDSSFAVANTTAGNRPSSPDLFVAGNVMNGVGEGGPDTRFLCVSGTSGHPAIVENNDISHCRRLGHMSGSYATHRKNRYGQCYHHGFTGSSLDALYVTDNTFQDNLFWCDRGAAGNSTSAAVQPGYNHRNVANNLKVVNNTVDGWLYGAVDFNDVVDANGPLTLTNCVVANNVIANGQYAFTAYHSATIPWYPHVLECDYNDTYNQATGYAQTGANGLTNGTNATGFYQSGSKYNRLTSAQRNIPSVALFDASYTTAQAGRTLAYTVNTLGTDHTLAWGSGDPVQLIFDSGTSAGAGLRTLACVGKSTWTANLNSIRQKWLWVVSGTGAGQARAINYVSANVAYAVTIAAGGTGYSADQYLTATGTLDTPGAKVVLKVTSVSGGAVTGIKVVSGGGLTAAPANPVATTRITGTSGASCTVNLSFAPGLFLVPDLATALDATSVFAIVSPSVTLFDTAGSTGGSVRAGIGMADPPDSTGTVTLPTTSKTDTGITVAVNHSPTGNPLWAGTFPGGLPTGVAADYTITASSAAYHAGTPDSAPSTDYFGTAFASPPSIGFAEVIAGGMLRWVSMDGGMSRLSGGMG